MGRFYITRYRWQRISLRFLSGIALLLLLAWAGLALYVKTHKRELLRKITATLSQQVQGRLSIRDMEPSFWRSFPDVSVSLKDVTLRDSLWEVHHHSLLDVKDLFVKVNTFGLLSSRVEIRKITAAHGSAFLYSDGAGYSNGYLLERRDTTKKNHTALLENFGMEDLHFYYINLQKQKDFHIYISSLDGTTTQSLRVMHFHVRAEAHVHSLAFNTARGSYIKDQDLHLNEKLDYFIDKKLLIIPEQKIGIGKESILMSARFFLDRIPAEFELHMHSEALPFETAKAWMSANISKLTKSFTFSKPLGVWIDISGSMQYRTIPHVSGRWTIRDNTLGTPLGNIEKMSADGRYYNEVVPGKGHGDDNSEIRLTSLKGSWQNLPFEGDTLAVNNLLVPYINAHVTSRFPLHSLNGVLGAETFSFDKGAAAADLHYVGGILADDPTPYALNGYVQLNDAALTYLPRALSFNNVGAKILFEGDNLFMRDVALRTRTSSISMEGDALHFLRLYFSDPGKILVSWRARSPQIDLNEFLSFAGRRRTAVARKAPAGAVSRIGGQLDRVLDASSIAIDAKVDRLMFKKFAATGVIAKATLAQAAIQVEKVALQYGGGSLDISGVIHQLQAQNPFSVAVAIRNADISGLLRAFDNFGQEAIVADNLRGKVTANISLAGGMSEGGIIVKNSLNGRLGLTLADGELNNYAPFEKISRFVFKKRALDHLVFKDLKMDMDIKGSNVTIHPMDIQTSAINMQVAGVYNLSGKGTDIAVQVPLRNPSKENAKTPLGKLLRSGKGMVVHLRAQDGGTAGVKIGWDPLHKGKQELPDSLKLD